MFLLNNHNFIFLEYSKMPNYINKYPNAAAIYANPNWEYYSPLFSRVAVLFNKNKLPFFIKDGKRQSFNRRKNNNGENRLFYGAGRNNYLMNTPSNVKNVFAHYKKSPLDSFYLTKRRPLANTLMAYKIRAAKMRARAKKNAAQAKRVNNLVNNVRANRNISRAKTANLLELVMRFQHPNAGVYYERNNKGRVVNNNGQKPTRKKLIANIASFKAYNFFA